MQFQNKPLCTNTSNLNNIDNLKSVTWFLNISTNKSESKSNKERLLDKEKPDFESKIEAVLLL